MQLEERDYFTDRVVLKDPYDYFAELYSKDPLYQPKLRDVMFVTGFEEANAILRNAQDFSSVIAVTGAAVPLPFKPAGDDISEQLELHRHQVPGSDILVTYDGPPHSATRSLLTSLFVPSRLKANQAYMEELAEKTVLDMVARGKCELIQDVAVPYVTLVIADLLGVPADDRDSFREVIASGPPPGNIDSEAQPHSNSILEHLAKHFVGYVMDRRANPRSDVLTQLAASKYPDGTTPDLQAIVGVAVFLFAAGQDTSAKLIGNCLRFLTEDKALQQQLREDRSQVAGFIEEGPGGSRKGLNQSNLPPGAAENPEGRGPGNRSRPKNRQCTVGCQPRSASLGRADGIQTGAQEDPGASGLWPWSTHLHRRAAGAGRSKGPFRPPPAAHIRHQPLR